MSSGSCSCSRVWTWHQHSAPVTSRRLGRSVLLLIKVHRVLTQQHSYTLSRFTITPTQHLGCDPVQDLHPWFLNPDPHPLASPVWGTDFNCLIFQLTSEPHKLRRNVTFDSVWLPSHAAGSGTEPWLEVRGEAACSWKPFSFLTSQWSGKFFFGRVMNPSNANIQISSLVSVYCMNIVTRYFFVSSIGSNYILLVSCPPHQMLATLLLQITCKRLHN